MSLFKNEYVETHVGDLCVYKDRTQVGDIVFITTDNFKRYIPIEWINEYIKKTYEYDSVINKMLKQWEKENETN